MTVGIEQLAFIALLTERAHAVNFKTGIVDHIFAIEEHCEGAQVIVIVIYAIVAS